MNQFLNMPRGVQKYQVKRVTHANGVHHVASGDQQPFASQKWRPPEQTTHSFNGAGGFPHPLHKATVVGFTVNSAQLQNSPDFKNFIAIGKPMTMKVTGKINIISGPISLTGASIACFSAR